MKIPTTPARRESRRARATRSRLELLHLEDRIAPAASPCYYLPVPASKPGGLLPARMSQAYGFDQAAYGGVKADGTGQTIAIISAYDAPNVAADAATFSSRLGLPALPSFRKVSQTGGTHYPRFDSTWAVQSTYDVELAHALAPGANILLVEADSAEPKDLFAAVDFARSQPDVSVVSMSWYANDPAAYEVQRSSDLIHWVPLKTDHTSTGAALVLDGELSEGATSALVLDGELSEGATFYRVIPKSTEATHR